MTCTDFVELQVFESLEGPIGHRRVDEQTSMLGMWITSPYIEGEIDPEDFRLYRRPDDEDESEDDAEGW